MYRREVHVHTTFFRTMDNIWVTTLSRLLTHRACFTIGVSNPNQVRGERKL